MTRISIALILCLTFAFSTPSSGIASPLRQSSTVLVRVCYDDTSCTTPTNLNSTPAILNSYTEQVLANEWHGQAGLEALKAGAIAIRTFAYRERGCGAFIRYHTENANSFSRLLDNRSQAFKIGNINGTQKTVTTDHIQARVQTDDVYLYRTDNAFACAKYDANTGNPTKACANGDCPQALDRETLPETIDPVETNNIISPRFSIGMSQNGSVAWGAGATPWNFRQILSHYYTKVKVGSNDNNDNRWVWLDVGSQIAHTGYGGEQYTGPVAHIPRLMTTGQTYSVPLHLQNTGDVSWDNSGSSAVRMPYHWYNSQGGLVEYNGLSTNLGQNVAPGGSIQISAQVKAPNQPGLYTLKWDMRKGTSTWFSQQNWPTQDVSVIVASILFGAHLPLIESHPSSGIPSH